MKSIVLKTFLLSLIILFQGCMPDSLTKFKEKAKPSTQSQGGSTGVAPANLDYGSTAFTFTRNLSIGTITPVLDGDADSISVTPALPAGLSLNTTTGVIFGTPTTATAAANYTITASNSAGSAAVILNIVVNLEPAPS